MAMKVGDYPLMCLFMDGAFTANSGGRAPRKNDIQGTPEEWEKAEHWFSNYWCDRPTMEADVHWMGIQADSGYTMYEQNDAEFDPNIQCECSGSKKALPWVILDRYY